LVKRFTKRYHVVRSDLGKAEMNNTVKMSSHISGGS
jgi:hypothetical protein